MSNSDRHNNDPLPAAMLGHAHGRIKGGQHLKYPQDSRFADLLRDAVRPQQHPGREDRRQRRPPLGGLRCARSLAMRGWLAVAGARAVAAHLDRDRRGDDAARRGRAGDRAAALRLLAKGAEPERARAGRDDGRSCGPRIERRSRSGPRADQGRRERQAEEPVRHVRADRGRHHRLGAGHRRAAQGGRRSQYQESGRRNAADGGRAQRQCRRGQAAAGGAAPTSTPRKTGAGNRR